MTTAKGFKVTDSERKSRVGIAAKSYDDLKRKTIEKFKLKKDEIDEIHFQTHDGTLIDTEDYFQTLPPQTLLVWVRNGEKAETDAEILYKTIREVNDEYLSAGEKVQEFFTEKMKSKVFKLAQVLRGIDHTNNSKLSLKSEHPEWFEGLDSNAKTKEEYMFRRAQDRIRTYYYKTREELLKNSSAAQTNHHLTEKLLELLHQRLKSSKFQGFIFDRSKIPDCLCDSHGEFLCQGRWNKNQCLYEPVHSINPYCSREARIIFQTWNLDHGIERARTIVPEILKSIECLSSSKNASSIKEQLEDELDHGRNKRKLAITELNNKSSNTSRIIKSLDVVRIFNDLFTLNNLKFVHIVCHDKGKHGAKVAGPYLLN